MEIDSSTPSSSNGNKDASSSVSSRKRRFDETDGNVEKKFVAGSNGEQRRKAVCKFWHKKKKFGFVVLQDTEEEVYVHKTQIKTFPLMLNEGDSCVLSAIRNDKGKLAAVDVHVDGCELANAEAGKLRALKKIAEMKQDKPPVFSFKFSSESTLDSKEKIAKAVSDYEMKITPWMLSWLKKNQVPREVKRVCQLLQRELERAAQDTAVDSEEFLGIVSSMGDIVSDQLMKRKQARLAVSDSLKNKHRRLEKQVAKASEAQQAAGGESSATSENKGNATSAAQTGSAGATDQKMTRLQGLKGQGPVEALKAIIKEFGPLSKKHLSAIYQKVTGAGFKATHGVPVTHILRENNTTFKLSRDKEWSVSS